MLVGQWYYTVIAGICALAALIIAVYQIILHLQHYTGPIFQRYICRIIFMVPLYAVMSFLSLVLEPESIYFASIRDCYEAFVIYNFLSLCLAYVGGPGSVEVKMNGTVLMPSWRYTTCCLPPMPVNGQFVRSCKQGALQFVIAKPILAIVQIVLYTQGAYRDGYWGPNDGYLWVTIIYNVTYSVALYALVLFYMGTHELLAPFNPLLKFAIVKMVVFLTFWQGLFVAVLGGLGVIKTPQDAKNLQNFLICCEMLPAAIGMLFAFPYSEYKGSEIMKGMGLKNMRHAISIHDVVSDTMHQFAPTYHDYVLYSNGGSKDAPKKVRAKTFVAVGHETANGVGNKDHMDANLLANMELGIYRDGSSARATADSDATAGAKSDDPAFMRGTEDSDDFYNRSARETTDDGLELSSAPVEASGSGQPAGKQKSKKPGFLRRADSEEDRGNDDLEDLELGFSGRPDILQVHAASSPRQPRPSGAPNPRNPKSSDPAAKGRPNALFDDLDDIAL